MFAEGYIFSAGSTLCCCFWIIVMVAETYKHQINDLSSSPEAINTVSQIQPTVNN